MSTMSSTRKLVTGRRLAAGAIVAAVAATVAGGVGTAWAGSPTAAKPPVKQPVKAPAAVVTASVGVQFHGMWQMYTDAQRIQVLDTLRAAGVKSVRLDVSWGMLQPTNATSYDAWGVAFVDRVIALAADRGIRPLVTLWLTPSWANHGQAERVLPDNPADYARVARWAAARYTTKVIGWEVWNEENSPDFLAGADPVAYTRLLKAAYPAFKAGSPGTPVVFGGVQYNDADWIRRAYDAGAKGSFDVLATHPYMGIADAPPATPDDGTQWTLTHVRAVHDLMAARGDGGKNIWFTELGWSTHANDANTPSWDRGVTEATQAAYLTQTANLVRSTYPYVTRMYWYNDRDLTDGGIQVQNYGLLHRDLTPKPAIAALTNVNNASTTGTTRTGTGTGTADTTTGTGSAAGSTVGEGTTAGTTTRSAAGESTGAPVDTRPAPSTRTGSRHAAASNPTASQVTDSTTGFRSGKSTKP
jgi:hypothetical protein